MNRAPVFSRRGPIAAGPRRVLAVLRAEISGSGVLYLFPLPFYLVLLGYLRRQGGGTITLEKGWLWALVVGAALLAMVYGLQSFAKEADRRTLDFTLSRPLPPAGLALAKYLLSLGVLLGWTLLFAPLFRFDLEGLGLARGMGAEWLLLLLLAVHAMGFLAGIISRGLERFFLVAVSSGVLAALSYFLWKAAFDLLAANYYWFDIPPVLLGAVSRGLPCYLSLLCVKPPVAVVLWHLGGRPRPWLSPPLRRAFFAWALTGALLGLCYLVFPPPLWPDRAAVSGDWRGGRVVLVTKGVPGDGEVLVGGRGLKERGALKLARLWGARARTIYTGVNLAAPRLSPDGEWVAFAEDGAIKAIRLADRRVIDLGPGDVAAWAHDSRRLVIARRIGKRGLSRLFLARLGGGKPVPLTEKTFDLSDLAWDSRADKLYIVGFLKDLSRLDLKTGELRRFEFPENDEPSIYLGVAGPATVLDTAEGRLYVGLINRYRLQLYALDLREGSLDLVEERVDRRLQTGAPLLIRPEAKALILPRIDGSFAYQSILLEAVREEE